MAALIVAGQAALEARGRWTRRMQAAAEKAETLDLQGVFARWYDATVELRQPLDMRREPNAGTITLVITASGKSGGLSTTALPSSRVRSFTPTPACTPIGSWIPEHQLIPGIALMLIVRAGSNKVSRSQGSGTSNGTPADDPWGSAPPAGHGSPGEEPSF